VEDREYGKEDEGGGEEEGVENYNDEQKEYEALFQFLTVVILV
jgi:hypothetical protein